MGTQKLALRAAGWLFALVSLCNSNLWAQFTSGIEGTVFDPSGAAVPGATVIVTNVATGTTRSVETSSNGYFRFTSLPAAVFDLAVEAQGFKRALLKRIQVQAAEVKTANVTMELGEATTQVDVTSEPPAVELSEGRVSGYVDEAKVHDLPLVGRNLYSLVVLTPGVTGLPSGGGQAYAQATADIFNAEYGVNLNANGQRAESNNFLIDSASVNATPRGGVTNLTPNAESVQEVRILVNNFSAEYGRNAGSVINVVTKQGTNDYHGTVSWFHTNNALTSRNIFQPRVPVFRRNEGAWSFGGPIRKNRTFAFASMDVLRSGVGIGNPAVVATPQFTDLLGQRLPNNISTFLLKNFKPQFTPNRNFRTAGALTGTACAGSDPISTPVGSLPCNFPVTGEGDFNITMPRNGLQWNARVDHNWNESKDRLYGNFYRTTRQTTAFATPSIYFPRFSPIGPEYTQLLNINWTHAFSPNVLNEMTASYTRAFGDGPCDRCDIPSITVTGLSGQFGGGGFIGAFVQNNFEWRDVMSFNRGTHTFKLGGTVLHGQQVQRFGNNYLRPTFSFLNVFDFANDSPFTEGNIGFDPKTGAQITPSWYFRQRTSGVFFHDDWKVRPNLTLNLGLRWETFGNPWEANDVMTNFVLGGREGDEFFGRITNLKVDHVPSLLAGNDWNNFAPRFGFAWDPTKTGKLSIRGGFGIFHDRFSNQLWASARSNPPFFALVTASVQTPPTLPVYGLGTSGDPPYGFPRVTTIRVGLDEKNGLRTGKVTLNGTDPNLRTQYGENWSLGVQYQFAGSWVAEGNYLGSVGHKLYAAYDVNRFSGDLRDGVLHRLNQSFGAIVYGQNNFNSAYHGGTFAVRNRSSHGFNFQAAYTFGKASDQASSYGPGLSVVDVTDTRRERALADFDVRQRLSFSILYHLPQRKSGSRILNHLVNGWELGNVTILQSGSPFSVFCGQAFVPIRDASGAIVGNNGCDFNMDGLNYDAPNSPSFGSLESLDRSVYLTGMFTRADFPLPSFGQRGNLGRNTYIGPGYANTDFSVIKNTKVPWMLGQEGANIQFRAEFFNVFNRVNLSSVQGNLVNPQFGRATATFPARNIQFGVRIAF